MHYIRSFQNLRVFLPIVIALFYWLPIVALGDEEGSEPCNPAGTPPQFAPLTHQVEDTSLVIIEGKLSATGTDVNDDFHRDATLAMDGVSDSFGTGRMVVAWEGVVPSSNCGKSAIYAVRLNSNGTSDCAPGST